MNAASPASSYLRLVEYQRLQPACKALRAGRQHGGTLLGLIFGLMVGVLVSFGVVWYLNKTPLPFIEKVTNPDAMQNDTAGKAPLALPGKPGDRPLEKPAERKFEFYDILEGRKDTPQPAQAPPPSLPPALPVPAATETAAVGKLFLQAGAFQKAADAENLKARLAMLGHEAVIIEADVPDKGRMHRVRIGPYDSTEEINRARSQLTQNGITAAVVRVKE